MNKYTVSIWSERTGFFQQRAYKTSARALHDFFSICATESYRNYQVSYEERLSSHKFHSESFAIKNVQPTSRRELVKHQFIVCPELFTLDDKNRILAAESLPLESIRPPEELLSNSFRHPMINSKKSDE